MDHEDGTIMSSIPNQSTIKWSNLTRYKCSSVKRVEHLSAHVQDSWDVQTAAVEPQEVGYQPFGYPQSYEGMVSPPQAPQV